MVKKKVNKKAYSTKVVSITTLDVDAKNREITVDNIINDTDNPLYGSSVVFLKTNFRKDEDDK